MSTETYTNIENPLSKPPCKTISAEVEELLDLTQIANNSVSCISNRLFGYEAAKPVPVKNGHKPTINNVQESIKQTTSQLLNLLQMLDELISRI